MARAEAEAQALLRALGIDELPVPVEKIAEHCGAVLRYEPFKGDISGLLYRDGDRTIIGINSLDGDTRQRFTICHELGHLRLHKGRPMFVEKHVQVNLRNSVSSSATSLEEIQANRFAAELLMPSSLVGSEASRRLMRNASISRDTLVAQMADAFRVSKQAMEIRLTNLGILFQS
jgi:Zn-dependent peptidase ImmA (M78 family)